MAKLISKIYGDALFDLCVEEDCLDAAAQEVLAVQEALAGNAEFSRLLDNPDVGKTEKLNLIEKIFKGRVSDYMVGFLRIVVDKQRYRELDHIWDYFIARVKEYRKIGVACVTSPQELSAEWKARIERKLLDTTGYVKMEMDYRVDPALIGGLVIRIGDTVVDSSIQSKLTDIGRRLMKTSLEQKERMQTS